MIKGTMGVLARNSVYRIATVRPTLVTFVATALISVLANAQALSVSKTLVSDWRHVGNTLIDRSLAGLATGPVDGVWYSADGSRLIVHTTAGPIFETTDFETWQPTIAGRTPFAEPPPPLHLPEPQVHLRAAGSTPRLYAFGKFVYKSDNAGGSWDDLTGFRNSSIVGEVYDLAVSPANEDEVTVVGSAGVFRSMDGGKSWSGLNQGLPNFPSLRLLSLPSGDRGVRVGLPGASVVEWQPGQKQAWLASDNADLMSELSSRLLLSSVRHTLISAVTISGNTIYSGTEDGRLGVSTDAGKSFNDWKSPQEAPVERFWVDSKDARVAIAVIGSRPNSPASTSAVHVLRTINGGANWDDMTGSLGDVGVHGVTADRVSGAVYIATDRGVFYTTTDLGTLGGTTQWTQLTGLPNDAAVADVRLDAGGNQLWTVIYGYGAYWTLAPHRLKDPRVVSSADLVARAAAPGSLMSIVGARVDSAQANNLSVPVLTASDLESQIQIPFDARGSSISLNIISSGGQRTLPTVPLQAVAPAIHVNSDGSPMLLDAGTGVMLDAMTPARSGSHVQILATGLGRVTPDWPAGTAVPVENPPKVATEVHAFVDRSPVEVTRAVLAPYAGFYLIDIEIPKIVNAGPAELYIELGGQESNRVRMYIDPGM